MERLGAALVQRLHAGDAHLRLRDRAGLIDAQHIDPRQRLDAVHVVQQHLFPRQPDGAEHQRDGREHIESLGDHAKHRRDRRYDAPANGLLIEEIALAEQHRTDRNDRNTGPFDDPVDGMHHLRLLAGAHRLGLLRQLRNERFLADLREPRIALPGNDEAAGQQACALRLFDLIRLAGQKRFVDLYASLKNLRVRTDLVARGKQDHVVLHQLLGVDLLPDAVSQHNGMRRVQKAHFVEDLLCAQLLHDADQTVCDHQWQERQILERADQTKHDRDQQKDEVEIGQEIALDDLAGRFLRRVLRYVDESLLDTPGDLAAAESGRLRRADPFLFVFHVKRFLIFSCFLCLYYSVRKSENQGKKY